MIFDAICEQQVELVFTAHRTATADSSECDWPAALELFRCLLLWQLHSDDVPMAHVAVAGGLADDNGVEVNLLTGHMWHAGDDSRRSATALARSEGDRWRQAGQEHRCHKDRPTD